jgi:hypothetical protein
MATARQTKAARQNVTKAREAAGSMGRDELARKLGEK